MLSWEARGQQSGDRAGPVIGRAMADARRAPRRARGALAAARAGQPGGRAPGRTCRRSPPPRGAGGRDGAEAAFAPTPGSPSPQSSFRRGLAHRRDPDFPGCGPRPRHCPLGRRRHPLPLRHPLSRLVRTVRRGAFARAELRPRGASTAAGGSSRKERNRQVAFRRKDALGTRKLKDKDEKERRHQPCRLRREPGRVPLLVLRPNPCLLIPPAVSTEAAEAR